MENKTVTAEILRDFEALLDGFIFLETDRNHLKFGLREILEKRLGETRVLYDSEKLAERMSHDMTFGWFPDDEPHHSTCACGPCLDRAANEKIGRAHV